MKSGNSLKKMVISALFMALVCVSTIVIQIPSYMNGYINLGDCMVLLSGWVLGPVYGAAADGIGSMLADVFTGYAYYAPGTLVIKAIMAVIAGSFLHVLGRSFLTAKLWMIIAGGTLAEVFMVLGYFAYAALLLGNGIAAASSIPGNLLQGAVGVAAGAAVLTLLVKFKVLREEM